jgi:hypothetical protein
LRFNPPSFCDLNQNRCLVERFAIISLLALWFGIWKRAHVLPFMHFQVRKQQLNVALRVTAKHSDFRGRWGFGGSIFCCHVELLTQKTTISLFNVRTILSLIRIWLVRMCSLTYIPINYYFVTPSLLCSTH